MNLQTEANTIHLNLPTKEEIKLWISEAFTEQSKQIKKTSQWLTKHDYSEKYKISIGSIQNAEKRGDLTTKRIGRRVYILDDN
jgi:hypothetical protein